MSHNIDTSKGFAAIALAQHRGPAWHGLGSFVGDTADLATWQARSGTDFTVLERSLFFAGAPNVDGTRGAPVKVEDRKALVRSDTFGYLATVGDGYEVVQPGELFEFQREVIESTGAKMDVAGSLRDGRTLWTLSHIDKSTVIDGVDRLNYHIMASTNFGQGRASTFGIHETRVVCENTYRMALSEKAPVISINHSRKVDIARVAAELIYGAEKAIDARRGIVEALASVVVDERAALDFIRRVIPNAIVVTKDRRGNDVAELSNVARKVATLAGRGQGAELSTAHGTAWGLVNAVTEYVDHYQKAKNPASRLHSAWFGAGVSRKDTAMDIARDMFLPTADQRYVESVDGSDLLDSLMARPVRAA